MTKRWLDPAAVLLGGGLLAVARPDSFGPALLLGAALALGRPAPAAVDAAAMLLWQVGWLSWFPETWERFAIGGSPPWMYPALLAVQAAPLAATAIAARTMAARIGPVGAAAVWTLGLALTGALQPVPTAPALVAVDVPAAAVWVALLGRDVAAALLFTWGAAAWRHPRGAAAALALAVGLGAASPAARTGADRVAVVQPNTGAFDGRRASTAPERAARLAATIAAADADWIVTSEGAWPLQAPWPTARSPLLLGASPGRPPTNALLALVGGTEQDRYEKHDLVPVAERAWLGLGHDRYQAGVGPRVIRLGDAHVGALICYEDLLGPAVADVAAADWIVVASNDTWLGGGHGNALHLAASRLVALETGLPVVRPTTSGTSAVIAPDGRLRGVIGWVDGDVGGPPTLGVRVAMPVATPRPRSQGWWRLIAAALVVVGLGVPRRPSGS